MITSGPTAHWVGPETLGGLWVEGREVDTLADSGNQVNTVMPGYVCQHEFPVLPLHDLANHPLNLVGLGGMRTHPLSFVILRVQVKEITGYNEDIVFLVVSDELEFSRCVLIMIGTCTLGRIINVIKESEMDRLSTPWAMVRASCLLSQWGTIVEDPGMAGDGPTEQGAMALKPPMSQDLDEAVFMKENVRLGPFQTQILECRVKPLIGESAHVMVTPLRAGETQPWGGGAQPLSPGLHVLHTYTKLKMSSSKVSVVVRNMSESLIFLKKGMQMVRVVSTLPVPPVEISLEMEAVLGAEDRQQPLSVAEQQRKLLEKLDLELDSSEHHSDMRPCASLP